MNRLSRLLALLACLLLPGLSHAYSAVAWVKGHPVGTIYAGWNFPSQAKADLMALQGCRTAAKKVGLPKNDSSCAVLHRQKGPGGGAMVCGKADCFMQTGSDTEQDAMDEAYQLCEQNHSGECQKTNIASWWDDAGYPKKIVKNIATAKSCGPPPGRTVRSRYECNNGDCTRTFENGCTVRFQAPYCHNPSNGQWEWKPDGC